MQVVSFTIPGRIKGKGRPKFARQGKFVRAYTPSDTVNAEAMVRSLGHQAMGGGRPLSGPVAIEISIFLNTPASWSKRRKTESLWVTGKPDCDNIVKLIGDALNGIAWTDDSQIAQCTIRRKYDDTGPERAQIEITALGQRAEVARAERASASAPLFARGAA